MKYYGYMLELLPQGNSLMAVATDNWLYAVILLLTVSCQCVFADDNQKKIQCFVIIGHNRFHVNRNLTSILKVPSLRFLGTSEILEGLTKTKRLKICFKKLGCYMYLFLTRNPYRSCISCCHCTPTTSLSGNFCFFSYYCYFLIHLIHMILAPLAWVMHPPWKQTMFCLLIFLFYH